MSKPGRRFFTSYGQERDIKEALRAADIAIVETAINASDLSQLRSAAEALRTSHGDPLRHLVADLEALVEAVPETGDKTGLEFQSVSDLGLLGSGTVYREFYAVEGRYGVAERYRLTMRGISRLVEDIERLRSFGFTRIETSFYLPKSAAIKYNPKLEKYYERSREQRREESDRDKIDKKDSKTSVAKLLAEAARLSPQDLKQVHAEIGILIKFQDDPVAGEIAREVTDFWEDRKITHPREAWIKNPSTFIRHVYRKWCDAGTLGHWHLKHDPKLYTRYSTHISQTPDDDLRLLKAKGQVRPVKADKAASIKPT